MFRFTFKKCVTGLVLLLMCELSFAWQKHQDPMERHRAFEESQFRTAENGWMRTPVDVSGQTDSVPALERQSRDSFWDDQIGAPGPLSQPHTFCKGLPQSNPPMDSVEFGDLDGVWLLGKFENYQTFLSGSQRSIYTEINFRVQHVFGSPDPEIKKGSSIYIDRPGGTIKAQSDDGIISCDVHPEQFDFQPNHTYLVVVHYLANGNFYTGVSRRWDLTSGSVKADSKVEVHRVSRGKSEIDGRKNDQVIELIEQKFAEHNRKGR